MLWSSAGPFAASAFASVFSTLEPDAEAAACVKELDKRVPTLAKYNNHAYWQWLYESQCSDVLRHSLVEDVSQQY